MKNYVGSSPYIVFILGLALSSSVHAQIDGRIYVHGLDAYGHGYADALLVDLGKSKDFPLQKIVNLPNGEIKVSIQATQSAGYHATATGLKLIKGEVGAYKITIGENSVKEILPIFGNPLKISPRELVYRGSAEICEDFIVLTLERSILQSIEWKWCGD